RHAALPEFPDRQALDPGIRQLRRSGTVQVALRLQPVSARQIRHRVSRNFVYDRRHGYTRGSHARKKNGRRDASRSQERPKQNTPDPAPHRAESRPRRRQAGGKADRGVHGCIFVPLLAVGGERVVLSTPLEPTRCQRAWSTKISLKHACTRYSVLSTQLELK